MFCYCNSKWTRPGTNVQIQAIEHHSVIKKKIIMPLSYNMAESRGHYTQFQKPNIGDRYSMTLLMCVISITQIYKSRKQNCNSQRSGDERNGKMVIKQYTMTGIWFAPMETQVESKFFMLKVRGSSGKCQGHGIFSHQKCPPSTFLSSPFLRIGLIG